MDAPVVVAPIVPHEKSSIAEREDVVQTLESLSRTCAFWSTRASDATGRAFRDEACRDMRNYAARTGQASPKIKSSGAGSKARKTPRRESASKSIRVNECTDKGRGSIAYRRCRVRENHRLKQMCYFHRERGEWRKAENWCTAYRHYPIVN